MTIKQIKFVAEKNYGDGLLIKVGNKVLGTFTLPVTLLPGQINLAVWWVMDA